MLYHDCQKGGFLMSNTLNPYRFNLTGSPRSVPILVRCRILFGGFLNQFGWLFFGFGMIFFWFFALNADLLGWYFFSGELETVQGIVTNSEKTGSSEGGSEHSKGTPIFANHYEFTYLGEKYNGTSYATGKRKAKGAKVKIELPKGNPDRSRIKGMRTAVFGPLAAFVVIFPSIGLCIIIAGLIKGRKTLRLLAHGKKGFGTLKSKEATNMTINDQRVYKLTFEFVAHDGRIYEATARTHETELLEDDAEEPLLYDPFRPAYSTMLDNLPGLPTIDQHGSIRTDSRIKSILVFFLPAVSIVGHGMYAYQRFFSS